MAEKKPQKKIQKLWNKAEKIVAEEKGRKSVDSLQGDDFALVQHIYQQMLKAHKKKHRKKAAEFAQQLVTLAAAVDQAGFTTAAGVLDKALAALQEDPDEILCDL